MSTDMYTGSSQLSSRDLRSSSTSSSVPDLYCLGFEFTKTSCVSSSPRVIVNILVPVQLRAMWMIPSTYTMFHLSSIVRDLCPHLRFQISSSENSLFSTICLTWSGISPISVFEDVAGRESITNPVTRGSSILLKWRLTFFPGASMNTATDISLLEIDDTLQYRCMPESIMRAGM